MGACVMHRFIGLIARFKRDERGAFAVMFGLMAIVLIAMGGAVVDYVTLEQTRNRAQIALDAAALALQPEIFEDTPNEEQIRADAEALLINRIGDPTIQISVDPVTINVEQGSLYLRARMTVPTLFITLVGVDELDAQIQSEATRRMLDLEIAMVLDNSGSMGATTYNSTTRRWESRMDHLKEAAACLTNIVYFGDVDDACDRTFTVTEAMDNVNVAIVPFTIMVNIGTGYANRPWLDWTGASSEAARTFGGAVDRRTLFSAVGASWRGCVEARVAPYDTDDTEPLTTETKFVPMFSPDPAFNMAGYTTWPWQFNNSWNSSTAYQHGYNFNNYLASDLGGTCEQTYCQRTVTQRTCSQDWSGNYRCTGSTTTRYDRVTNGVSTNLGTTSCIPGTQAIGRETRSQSGSTITTVTRFSSLTERQLQERICKYSGQTVTDSANFGPNAYCPDVTLMPLTEDPDDVYDKIDDMRADGGTNIQQGTVWGLHALTNTEPLTEGLSLEDNAVSKVMIVMTDGFNEPDYRPYSQTWNGTAIYGAWGFRKDGRLGGANAHFSKPDVTAEMNARTLATCQSAKDMDIIVFTVGLNPPDNTTREMLEDCSSGAGYFFFPATAAELTDDFRTIAEQLAPLRLAL